MYHSASLTTIKLSLEDSRAKAKAQSHVLTPQVLWMLLRLPRGP